MSMMDVTDDVLLGDDDELDYDLEKDEEDALLADGDDYEEDTYDDIQTEDTYDENQTEEHQDEHYEEPVQNEEESDILDIDTNVGLDETEEDFGDQSRKDISNNSHTGLQLENDDDDEVEEQKERNRFLSERTTTTISRTNISAIPETLDKVAVPQHNSQRNINNNNNNGRYYNRGRGRGRGRQNFNNRGPVFNRIGNLPQLPPMEGKTVLINPHFRGNVQVTENARLVWDQNFQNSNFPQQRYQGPQMAQVAPFQAQPSPWINPPYENSTNNFNHPQGQPNYQEPPPQQIQYNQPQEIVGIRPLMPPPNQPPPFSQPPPQQQMGNFRGRDARFNNQQAVPPLLMNPPPNFNQQQNNFPGRNNYSFPDQNIPNQNRQYINPNHQNIAPLIPNFPPPHQQQNFDQPPQHFPQNQFNQNRQVQEFNEHNQFQNQHQFPPPINHNQNFQGQNFQQTVSHEPNFTAMPPPQENFPPNQFSHHFNENRQNNPQHRQINQYNRTPPKRRSFENIPGSGDRDLPKKKKRSMEFSNLHEVPTVDMPDTTTGVNNYNSQQEKEEESEEDKAYRLRIEEQKRLREKLIQQKEERRKQIAAQKAQNLTNTVPTVNLISTVTTNVQQQQIVKQQRQQPIVKQQQQQPIVKQQQQQPIVKQQQITQQQPNHQNWRQYPKQQQQQQKWQQQQQRQQQGQIQTNRPQNIQIANQGRVQQQQRRMQQTNQQANIVITQKIEPTSQQRQQQLQRVVTLRQQALIVQNPPRRVVLKGMNAVSNKQSTQQSQEGGNLSSFLSNRKVISNTSGEVSGVGLLNQPAMLDTPVVVVSNLAAGTTDVKIRKLCQGLGPIQNVQMNSNQRQATIRFKNIVSAHRFFKKYQRKIIDLSMIQVTLEPESKL